MAILFNYENKYPPGTIVGDRYRVVEFLGAGSVGCVLRASDEQLDREILAIKLLHPHLVADPKSLERFRNEVAVTRQLSHPNIVRVYDFDEISSQRLCLIVMECIDGPSLRTYLDVHKGKRLGWEDASRILFQIAEALSFAHRKKIIHRDIKPANILLGTDGQAKLSDFGIAESLQISQGLTRTGEALGTPLYMSPEHFSQNNMDCHSDIYSLGVVAFEMVSGKVPFADDNYFVLARKHHSDPIPEKLLDEHRVPEWYRVLITRCLEKDASARFRDGGELRDYIEKHASQTVQCPRVVLKRSLPGKPLLHRFLSPRKRLASQLVLILFFICIVFLTFREKRPRRFLMREILRFEQHFGVEFPKAKSLLDFSGYSPLRPYDLHKAARRKHHTPFRVLLLSGVDPDVTDENGNSAFHIVAKNGWYDGVHYLTSQKGNQNLRNHDGDTPVFLAIKHSQLGVALHLFWRGVDLDLTDNEGNNLFHIIAMTSSHALLKKTKALSSHFCRCLWKQNAAGETPLHIAVKRGSEKTVRALLDLGAFPQIQDSQGRTPLELASRRSERRYKRIVQILRDYGARR